MEQSVAKLAGDACYPDIKSISNIGKTFVIFVRGYQLQFK